MGLLLTSTDSSPSISSSSSSSVDERLVPFLRRVPPSSLSCNFKETVYLVFILSTFHFSPFVCTRVVYSSKSSDQAHLTEMIWEKRSSSRLCGYLSLGFDLKVTSAHCAQCSQWVDVSLCSKLKLRNSYLLDLQLFSSSRKYLSWANSSSALSCYTTLMSLQFCYNYVPIHH